MRCVAVAVAVLVCSSIQAQPKSDVTKVSPPPASSSPARQPAIYELVSGPVEPAPDCECYVWTECWCTTLPTSLDAAGYSTIGALVRTGEGGGAAFELLWRWSADEPFTRVHDAINGVSFRGVSGERYIYPGIGGTFALHVEWYTGTVIESARVYLIP